MSRALSSAEHAADIALLPAAIDDFTDMASFMFLDMTWKHIGTLAKREAGRLKSLREAQIFAGDKNPPVPQGTEGSVPTGGGWPGGKVETGLRAGNGDESRMEFDAVIPDRDGSRRLPLPEGAARLPLSK